MKSAPIPLQDEERLAALYRYDILDTEAEPEFDEITQLAAQICEAPLALTSLVDKDRHWFKSRVGFDTRDGARNGSFCGHAILAKEVLEIPDVTQDERFRDHPFVTSELNVRSYAGAPLLTPQGHAIGTLCVFDKKPRVLSRGQVSALEVLGRQIIRQMDLRLHLRRAKELNQHVVRQRNCQNLLSDSALAGVAWTTPAGLITRVNPAFEQLVRHTAAELVQQKNIRLFHLEAELQARAKELSGQLDRQIEPDDSLFAPSAMGIPDMRDWTYRREDGSVVSVLVSTCALHDPDGVLNGYVAMTWDLTELQKVREEIVTLNADLDRRVKLRTAELERKTEDLQLLSYSLAHDLRQPLITIRGYSHLLNNRALTDGERQDVQRMVDSIEQVNARADGLLYFTNLSRRRLRRVTLDLAPIASYQLSRLQRLQPGRQLMARVQPGLSIWADRDLMTDAINELIFNAWKFTAGREQSVIEVGCEIDAKGEAIYFVRDNGAGFNMAYANTLFEPFQQIDTLPESAGHGIGLAKVKGILTKHGGRLWVTSELDVGSTFYFTLPPLPKPYEARSPS